MPVLTKQLLPRNLEMIMASTLITLSICPVLLFACLLFQEVCLSIPGLQSAVLGVLILGSAHLIMNPPATNAFLKGATAFISILWIIRFMELMLAHNVANMKRIRRLPFSPFCSTPVYAWQSRPKELSYDRILWTLDLVTNIRAVGWSHGPTNYRPPSDSLLGQKKSLPDMAISKQGSTRTTHSLNTSFDKPLFIRQQLRRILSAYAVVDIYQTWFPSRRCQSLSKLLQIVQEDVNRLASAICIYALLDGGHALISFIAIGAFGSNCLGTAGEPWAYPPLFGSPCHFLGFNLGGIYPHRLITGEESPSLA
jgi:hypothetical protein